MANRLEKLLASTLIAGTLFANPAYASEPIEEDFRNMQGQVQETATHYLGIACAQGLNPHLTMETADARAINVVLTKLSGGNHSSEVRGARPIKRQIYAGPLAKINVNGVEREVNLAQYCTKAAVPKPGLIEK